MTCNKPISESVARAALYAALGQLAKREDARDELAGGKTHDVELAVIGSVDGQRMVRHVRGPLSIGHDSTQARSTAAPVAKMIAYLLAFAPKTRRAEALERLVDDYTEAGGELRVDPILEQLVEASLAKMRQSKSVTVRGSVRYEYQQCNPSDARKPKQAKD